METNINPTDITHPTTPSTSLRIKAAISSAYSLFHLPMQSLVLKSHSDGLSLPPSLSHSISFFIYRCSFCSSGCTQFFSTIHFPPCSNHGFGQAVHYFKFMAWPFGLPLGGITSGFGWRGYLPPNLLLWPLYSWIWSSTKLSFTNLKETELNEGVDCLYNMYTHN